VQNKEGDNALHGLIRSYNLSHIKQCAGEKASSRDASNNSQGKLSAINMACILIQNGCDLYARNKKQQTPMDICTDSSLTKLLLNQFKEHHKLCSSLNQTAEAQVGMTSTLSISSASQANRISMNAYCSSLTDSAVSVNKNSQEFLEECMICSDSKREVLFKPCNHITACEACASRCKKCLICKCYLSCFILDLRVIPRVKAIFCKVDSFFQIKV
jgi:E3 ubiquitin-protein ligase mind-bomb